MLAAVICAAVWIGIATVVALCPRKYHPPGALMLLVLLFPLIPFLWIAANPFVAIMFSLGVCSILRWPFYYIGRELITLFTGKKFEDP